MSKKIRKQKKKVVYLPATTFPTTPMWCGFPLNLQNFNRLWKWDSLEDV